ncbi:MAG TPA: universal stress protein [Bryobacteraceae bacterium]|jgi:nucleotide-binding universal stress UspA family protein
MAMVPYVKEMAHRFGSAVTVLNAFDLVPDYCLAPRTQDRCDLDPRSIPYTPVLQELRKRRENQLQEFSCMHFSGVEHTMRLVDGDPATVIEWVARIENTGLIMMPTKGRGRFRRLLLGSATAKVLHDLSCLVFTSAHDSGSAAAAPGAYQSILCAVDLNAEADAVLKTAAFLAQAYGAKLCLLHVQPSGERGAEGSGELVRRAFEQALHADGIPNARLNTTVRVLDDGVPAGVRLTAKEIAADLLVVGRGHQDRGLSRMWSHLYAMICDSHCPVLSV